MSNSLDTQQRWAVARLAFWYLERGRWQQAEALARGLLAMDSSDGMAWNYYGESRRRQGDHAEAARGFEEAARLMGDDPKPWLKLGISLLQLQRSGKAKQALERAHRCCEEERLRRRIEALLAMC